MTSIPDLNPDAIQDLAERVLQPPDWDSPDSVAQWNEAVLAFPETEEAARIISSLVRMLKEKEQEVDDKSEVGHRVAEAWEAEAARLADELGAARKAIDLIKRDGHINPGENCLTCEAVAEFENRGR